MHHDVGAMGRAAGSRYGWRWCCPRSAEPRSCRDRPRRPRGVEDVDLRWRWSLRRTPWCSAAPPPAHASRSSGSGTNVVSIPSSQRVANGTGWCRRKAWGWTRCGPRRRRGSGSRGSAAWPGQQQRRHPALKGGDALLDDVGRRVHQPGVDVARLSQTEQRGGVVGAVEGVGGGLVDRRCARGGMSLSGFWPAWICLVSKDQLSRWSWDCVPRCHWLGCLRNWHHHRGDEGLRPRGQRQRHEGSASGFPVSGARRGGPRLPCSRLRLLNLVITRGTHRGWRVAGQQTGLDAGAHDRLKE